MKEKEAGFFGAMALVAIGVLVLVTLPSLNPTATGSSGLTAWEEDCATGYLPNNPNFVGNSICAVSTSPIRTPTSFNLTSVVQNQNGEVITLHDVDIGVVLAAGEAFRVSMNSTAPATLKIFLDNRTGYDVNSLANEAANYATLITNSSGLRSFDQQISASQSALYIFELSPSQPMPVATVAFEILRV